MYRRTFLKSILSITQAKRCELAWCLVTSEIFIFFVCVCVNFSFFTFAWSPEQIIRFCFSLASGVFPDTILPFTNAWGPTLTGIMKFRDILWLKIDLATFQLEGNRLCPTTPWNTVWSLISFTLWFWLTRSEVILLGSLYRPSSSLRLYPSGLLSRSLIFHNLIVLSV